jgi:dihydrofolate reductase
MPLQPVRTQVCEPAAAVVPRVGIMFAMRRLILEEWLSLDGFAVDRGGRLDFFHPSETDQFSDQEELRILDSVDTILLGRKTYQLFVGFWPNATTNKEIVAERLNTLPKLVFSNTLSEAPWAVAEIAGNDETIGAKAGKRLTPW